MKRQAFQPGEIRDENDTIIREGAYGKKSAFATADNKGILDYMINNFDALYDAVNGGRVYVNSASNLPKTGDTAAVYIANDTGKWYYWDPATSKYVTIDNARTIANDAITARDTAKAWAESGSSPDGATDSDSSTGKTQSSKSWALYSKDRATASASSASASASSASAAKTSQSAAASSASASSSSASAASSSATNAKNSQTAAASSASAAKTSETNAATSETNAKTALVSCQNIQTQVNNGLQSLTSAVKYRGSVASFSALPTSGQSVGDMYNIKAAGGTDANGTAIRAGDNVVWNGSGWDDQAGTVDLSNYYTKSEMNGAVVSATVSDATLTLIYKDASKSTVTVNNVAHASKASQDDKGQAIDIAALKTLITSTSAYKNQLQRNKTYSVGDIAYSPSLPSWAYLECTTAGTTGASEPDFSSVSTSGGAIADMTDGAVHWRVRDTRCRYEVGDIIAKTTTPKSYEYLLPCNGSAFDKTKYPMLAKIFTTGNVPNLTDGRFLEGSASAGISKNAGLPNIIGSFKICGLSKGGLDSQDGAFSNGGVTYGDVCAKNDGYPDGYEGSGIGYFDASRYNSIYGLSDTVQPKSYTVQYYVCYGG